LIVEAAAKAVQEDRPSFEVGQQVTVQSGDYAGSEVEVIDVKGVVVMVKAQPDADPIALLSTEITAPALPEAPKPISTKNHPLADQLEASGAQFKIIQQRVILLEDLLAEVVPVLPIGDLRSRIQAVL
jgi:hypothetical protein